MKIRFLFCIILLATLFVGCKKDEKETVVLMTVDAETVWRLPLLSIGFPDEYMQVKEVISDEVSHMYFSQIEGFNYEKGFEYLIKVKKTKIDNPPMDGYSISYSLIEVISKTEVGDNGIVVSLIVSAEVEWVYLYPEQSRPYPLFLLVKEADADEWERYPVKCISNFNYEFGFEYHLKVKKYSIEPPQEYKLYGEFDFILNHSYWLIEITSKTEYQK